MENKLTRLWFAVRKNEFGEWIDSNSCSVLREMTEDAAKEMDAKIPQWAHEHPVVRFAEFELLEVRR